jgi:rhodanese-related sulfurtransferase
MIGRMVRPMRILLAAVLLFAACDKADSTKESSAEIEAAEKKVGSVTPDELASLLETKKAQPIDANNDATRSREGVVPGATLLSNYREYDLSVLPSDKAMKLVFYCANEQCGASHKAAARAVLAGWSDVAVMPAGIAGWKSSGKRTQPNG